MDVNISNPYSQLTKQEELGKKNRTNSSSDIILVSTANLPTKFGYFNILTFNHSEDKKEHTAIVKGDILGKKNVLVRIHSECLTGDALGSLRCDCGDLLKESLRKIEEEGQGLIIYLRQEGRGIGLNDKIRAYELQDHGLDTYEANIALGYPEDIRDYDMAGQILKCLKVNSIRLITNNPQKIKEIQKLGIVIKERIGHTYSPNQYNKKYLHSKKEHGFYHY